MYKQIDSNKRRTVILIILFIILIIALGYIITYIFGYGYDVIILAAIFSIVMTLFSYYSGDKVALWSAGAKLIKKEDNPYVYRMVENLCITAGIPYPEVYIINDPAPNAFATGRDPEHASVALTTGLIERMENEELEGVIAHELSHIKNYDIRLMMVVLVLVGFIAIVSNMFLRVRISGSNRKGGAGGILVLVGVVLMLLSPLIAKIIQLAISRKREYLADASGALLTRYPEGLAKALEKIAEYKEPMLKATSATAHLYISSPFGASKKFMANLFSTHPPIEERIKSLREMA